MNLIPSDEIPGPPAGPGVRTPFAAPPTERDRKRLWIGLGVGLAVLVLCCGGGVFGFGALVVAQNRAIPREAATVVDEYLHLLSAADYDGAYNLLCRGYLAPESEFRYRQQRAGDVQRYEIGTPRVGTSQVVVPARVWRASGLYDHNYVLVEDQQAGGLRICGGE
jgi:hypothetical protein